MVLFGCVVATSGTAASTSLKLRLGSQVQLLSPESALAPIAYYCVESAEPAEIDMGVSQENGAFLYSGSATVPLPCTGEWETIDLFVFAPGPGFPLTTLGAASAGANLRHEGQFEHRERKVRIVD